MAEQVLIIEFEMRADGTIGLGNTIECPVDVAVKRIQAGEAKALHEPIDPNTKRGIVPAEWLSELNAVAVEESESGGDSNKRRSRIV